MGHVLHVAADDEDETHSPFTLDRLTQGPLPQGAQRRRRLGATGNRTAKTTQLWSLRARWQTHMRACAQADTHTYIYIYIYIYTHTHTVVKDNTDTTQSVSYPAGCVCVCVCVCVCYSEILCLKLDLSVVPFLHSAPLLLLPLHPSSSLCLYGEFISWMTWSKHNWGPYARTWGVTIDPSWSYVCVCVCVCVCVYTCMMCVQYAVLGTVYVHGACPHTIVLYH